VANRTVTLLRYAHLPKLGWRRGLAVFGKTGKVTPDFMFIGKRGNQRKVHAPDGHYELRYYEGRLPRYKALGNDPTEAFEELKKSRRELEFKNSASAAGYILPSVTQPKQKSLADYGRDFLEQKQSLTLHPDTNDLYTVIVKEFLPVCGRTFPADVTEADVIRYCNRLDERYAARTRATRYTSLRGFLFYCGLEPKRLITPSVHKKLKSYEKKKVRIYSGEEIRNILGVCDPYHHALFMTALLTGMRDDELAHLLWRMVDFEANLIRLEDYEIVHRRRVFKFELKDGEARDIPLFPALREELLRLRKTRGKSVFVLGTSHDLPNVKILDALKRKARKAGLNCGICLGCASRKECYRFHTHYFRSSFASYALEHNQIGKVQAWMGHSDLETLSKYVGLAESCPEWLANLYVEFKAAFSQEREAIPASIVFPNIPVTSSVQ